MASRCFVAVASFGIHLAAGLQAEEAEPPMRTVEIVVNSVGETSVVGHVYDYDYDYDYYGSGSVDDYALGSADNYESHYHDYDCESCFYYYDSGLGAKKAAKPKVERAPAAAGKKIGLAPAPKGPAAWDKTEKLEDIDKKVHNNNKASPDGFGINLPGRTILDKGHAAWDKTEKLKDIDEKVHDEAHPGVKVTHGTGIDLPGTTILDKKKPHDEAHTGIDLPGRTILDKKPIHDLKAEPIHDLKAKPIHDLKAKPIHDLKAKPSLDHKDKDHSGKHKK